MLGTSLSVLSKGGEDGGGGKEGSSFYGRSLNDALNRDREEVDEFAFFDRSRFRVERVYKELLFSVIYILNIENIRAVF